jgi:hypothetical protein
MEMNRGVKLGRLLQRSFTKSSSNCHETIMPVTEVYLKPN